MIWKKILISLLFLRLVLMAIVPVFDPSEARYAAISANMARTGDFVVPRFTYEGRYQSFDGKPPLVFQAGGMIVSCFEFLVSGSMDNPYALQFAVRIFPLLSAILVLGILFYSVKRSSGTLDPTEAEERAWLAVVICATCTAFYAAAGISMTDMTLTCCVAGALLLYGCVVRGGLGGIGGCGERGEVILHSSFFIRHSSFFCRAGVAVLLGAGMITKGPVALVMFGLPVLVDAIVNRHWKFVLTWKWLVVAPIFFIVAVPWFVLIEQRNPGAVWYFFYNENFMRFISHDYGDKYGAGREAFRGVSILWALVATLPWSLCLVPRAWCLVRRWWKHEAPSTKHQALSTNFNTLAILAIVGFWCLTSRVLLYYLFPVIPLFASALALKGDRKILRKLAPWVAGFSALLVTIGFASGAACSRKMRGAKAPETYGYDGYAHEFYHGTNPRCQKERGVSLEDSQRDQWLKTPEGMRWLDTPQGKQWQALPDNRLWMKEWGYAK